MSTRFMALCVSVLASSCGSRPFELHAGSELDPDKATGFWCSATGQCFTEEQDCFGGPCFGVHRASCATYLDGGYPRFLCGIDEETCERMREQLPVTDVGSCITRAALSTEDSLAATPPQQPIAPVDTFEAVQATPASAPAVQAPPPAPVAPVAPAAPVVVVTPPRHDYAIAPTTVAQVEIEAVPAETGGWDVHISNNSDGMVLVVWDESTFVTPGDQSRGRLIRTAAPRQDMQASTPVAPHSRTTENVLIEKVSAADTDTIIGGRMVLTLQLPDRTQIWTGVVQAKGATPAPAAAAAAPPAPAATPTPAPAPAQ